jgi:hypothetical protein
MFRQWLAAKFCVEKKKTSGQILRAVLIENPIFCANSPTRFLGVPAVASRPAPTTSSVRRDACIYACSHVCLTHTLLYLQNFLTIWSLLPLLTTSKDPPEE